MLCDGELSLLMHVPEWNKMERYISWAWIKPPPLSQTWLLMGSWESICQLTWVLSFKRTKASRFTSSPHTQKDRGGLPSSSMLLSTWGFSQNGGGRLEKTSQLWLPHSSALVPAFSSVSNQVCNHVHVWLRRLAYMRSRRPIADKHAKLGCTALPRAHAS